MEGEAWDTGFSQRTMKDRSRTTIEEAHTGERADRMSAARSENLLLYYCRLPTWQAVAPCSSAGSSVIRSFLSSSHAEFILH